MFSHSRLQRGRSDAAESRDAARQDHHVASTRKRVTQVPKRVEHNGRSDDGEVEQVRSRILLRGEALSPSHISGQQGQNDEEANDPARVDNAHEARGFERLPAEHEVCVDDELLLLDELVDEDESDDELLDKLDVELLLRFFSIKLITFEIDD
jgi:hypothetical protein